MKLLFLNRSYWPDVEATGQLLTELCTDLARKHEVAVIAGQPNYVDTGRTKRREKREGVQIIRVNNRRFTKLSFLGRVIGLLSYVVLAGWTALWQRRPDVIIVETDPPLLGALGSFLKLWHRCKLVYYLQDLYPEVGLANGRLRPGILTWLLRVATQTGMRSADRVVVLGEDMKERVAARGVDTAKVDIVPNWADTSVLRPVAGRNPFRESLNLPGRFVVMYSGNHGMSQGLEHVLAAARELASTPAFFLFVGNGGLKSGLVAQAKSWSLDNVRFLPYQPKDELTYSLGAADLHLITLLRGLAGCIVPSKLYGILAAGVPYVAMMEPSSEVARVTQTHRCGLRIEPDSPGALAEAIRWCLAHPDELREMGRRGRTLAETTYHRTCSVRAFEDVLTRVDQRTARVARDFRSVS